MSFSSQISSISDGNLFKKKTHDSKQKTLFTSTNLNQLTIIKEQSNEFSSKELDQNNSLNLVIEYLNSDYYFDLVL